MRQAYDAAKNSMRYFEKTQYDPAMGLFDGPGWSDGVAGYPMPYADVGNSSYILDAKGMKKKVLMKALSTNCL